MTAPPPAPATPLWSVPVARPVATVRGEHMGVARIGDVVSLIPDTLNVRLQEPTDPLAGACALLVELAADAGAVGPGARVTVTIRGGVLRDGGGTASLLLAVADELVRFPLDGDRTLHEETWTHERTVALPAGTFELLVTARAQRPDARALVLLSVDSIELQIVPGEPQGGT